MANLAQSHQLPTAASGSWYVRNWSLWEADCRTFPPGGVLGGCKLNSQRRTLTYAEWGAIGPSRPVSVPKRGGPIGAFFGISTTLQGSSSVWPIQPRVYQSSTRRDDRPHGQLGRSPEIGVGAPVTDKLWIQQGTIPPIAVSVGPRGRRTAA